MGVVIANSGLPRADSDSDSGSERPPPAIEVLVANNNVIGKDACQYLENVLESLREIRKENPTIKGSPRLPFGTILMDTTKTHGNLFVKLELSILEHVWPKLHPRIKKSHRDTTFLDVVKYIQGDEANTQTDIPEDLRLVLHDLQSSKGLLIRAEDDMGVMMYCLTRLLDSKTPTLERLDLTWRVLHEVHSWTRTLGKHPEFIRNWNNFALCQSLSIFRNAYLTDKKALSVVIRKNPKSDPIKHPDVLHWLSKIVAPCAHFLRISDIPSSRKLSDWLLGDIRVVPVYDPSVGKTSEAVIDGQGVKKTLKAAGLEEEDYTAKKITCFLEGLSKAFNTPFSDGKIGKGTALFLYFSAQ